MNKQQFRNIIVEGIKRDKRLLAVKIKEVPDFHPKVVIIQSEDINYTVKQYLKFADDNMFINKRGDQIIDALMTNNVNDLSWFMY